MSTGSSLITGWTLVETGLDDEDNNSPDALRATSFDDDLIGGGVEALDLSSRETPLGVREDMVMTLSDEFPLRSGDFGGATGFAV